MKYCFLVRNNLLDDYAGSIDEPDLSSDRSFYFSLESRKRAVELAQAINAVGMFWDAPKDDDSAFCGSKASNIWFVDWIFELDENDEDAASIVSDNFDSGEWDEL